MNFCGNEFHFIIWIFIFFFSKSSSFILKSFNKNRFGVKSVNQYNNLLLKQSNMNYMKHQVLFALPEEEILTNKPNITNYSIIVLGTLLLTFISNQWSRQLIYYLCNFGTTEDSFKYVNIDLSFDKEFYSALASFGFTTVFALFSIFAGSIADKYNRKAIISVSCFGWSLATILQSTVTTSTELIPLRVFLGSTQAFFNPAAFTILSDIFPTTSFASVSGILSSGVYLGGALASLSILLDDQYGWRSTTQLVGLVGLVLSVLCAFIIPEPRSEDKSLIQ